MQFLKSTAIQRALNDGTYPPAFRSARALTEMNLGEGLDAVFEVAETDQVIYDARAVRWLLMAAESMAFTLSELEWAASRFMEHLQPGRNTYGSMKRLVGKRQAGTRRPQGAKPEVYETLDRALTARDYGLAARLARSLSFVSLRDALRLTVLAARKDPEHYDAMAKRWLIRFMHEHRPSLKLLSWIADDFDKLADPEETPWSIRQPAEGRMAQMIETMEYRP